MDYSVETSLTSVQPKDIENEEANAPIIDATDQFHDKYESDSIVLHQCSWLELISAVLAGCIFIALRFVPGKLKNALFIGVLGLFVGCYVIYKTRKFGIRLVAEDWGLTLQNFRISFLWCTAVGALGTVVMLIYMAIFKTGLPFHYDLVLMLILYPIWGVLQQFLVQAMVAVNLSKTKLPIYVVYLLTACSFTLVHWANWLLMLATFILGLLFTPIFLRWKCLYPLGLYHGWCGALFYWLVLDNNPLERFG